MKKNILLVAGIIATTLVLVGCKKETSSNEEATRQFVELKGLLNEARYDTGELRGLIGSNQVAVASMAEKLESFSAETASNNAAITSIRAEVPGIVAKEVARALEPLKVRGLIKSPPPPAPQAVATPPPVVTKTVAQPVPIPVIRQGGMFNKNVLVGDSAIPLPQSKAKKGEKLPDWWSWWEKQ